MNRWTGILVLILIVAAAWAPENAHSGIEGVTMDTVGSTGAAPAPGPMAAQPQAAANSTAPAAVAGPRSMALGILKRLARLVLFTYGALCVMLFLAQTWVIFPGRATQGTTAAVVHPVLGEELLTLTAAGGEKVAALFGSALSPDGQPHPEAATRPTMLYFYGNAMCLRDAHPEFSDFRSLGVNVLVPDYLGYGMSGGTAGEAGCRATADACWEYLMTRKDVNPKKVVVAGWSLGGGVAIDLASRKPVAGIATFCTFTSMIDMGKQQYPFVPIALLLRHRFESEKKLAEIACPIFLGHGRLDSAIPFAMMERLAEVAKGKTRVFPVDAADHNDYFIVGGNALLSALGEFLDRL
ncbi:MAG: alpha/beta hydrolase [Planctomycetes bacterium]|nr:alpha/beta hydrolase [Planctomycetota bacterium]